MQRTQPSSLGLRQFQGDRYVAFEDVHMRYGSRTVFNGMSCSFPRGKISVILGGSGLGKSTILRLIGGLIHPDSGKVQVDGANICEQSPRQLTKTRRKMGMMFQGGALLDSYTVFENVALPLREHGACDNSAIRNTVQEMLDAVGVGHAAQLHPRQLSGGMLRRVALARAIVRKPELILCDEPFSGLDPTSIRQIEALLVQINKQYGMTMIVVSHDFHSTIRMADHVLLVMSGRVLEGTPETLMQTDDREASDFLRDGVEVFRK